MKKQQALLAAIVSGLLAATIVFADTDAPPQPPQDGAPAQTKAKDKSKKDKSKKDKTHKANKGKSVGGKEKKEPNSCGGAGGEHK